MIIKSYSKYNTKLYLGDSYLLLRKFSLKSEYALLIQFVLFLYASCMYYKSKLHLLSELFPVSELTLLDPTAPTVVVFF